MMLTVEDGPEKPEAATVPLHKKDPSIGNKTTIKLRVRSAVVCQPHQSYDASVVPVLWLSSDRPRGGPLQPIISLFPSILPNQAV